MTAVGCRFLTFVVIVAFTAACTSSNGSPSPSPTPPTGSTSTSSPTPTPSEPLTTGPNVRPGEKPPEFPALAKKHTANGALAFAIYYFKAFDWGYATNDAFLVKEISAPSCRACRIYVNAVNSLERKHEILRGGRITFDSASVFHGQVKIQNDYVIDVSTSEEPVVIRQSGAPASTAAPRDVHDHSLVFVLWMGGGWSVVEVTGA